MKQYTALICILLLTVTYAKLSDDAIQFPTWPSSYTNNFSVYSGFISPNDKSKAHYMLVTYDKQGQEIDFYTQPVLLWFSGGQGCSSLQSLIEEIGPYRMKYPRKIFSSIPNEYAWNKYANLLFIEAPMNVGYSQYDGGEDEYEYSDERTASDVYDVLVKFYSENPDFKKSTKFLIGGEGMSGQFIPLIAEKIVKGNEGKQLGDSGYIPLQTLLLGNAMLEENTTSDLWEHYHNHEFLHYHGLYGPQMEELWYSCTYDSLTDPSCEYFQEQSETIKVQLNPYNVNEKCEKKVSDPKDFQEDISESAYCLDWSGMETFFKNNKDKFNLGDSKKVWQVCHMAAQMNWKPKKDGSVKVVESLISGGIDVLLYSGLNDSTVSYLTTETYLKDLARVTKVKKLQQFGRFSADSQVAGWTTAYEHLQFVRVKGAGHMVPYDQPAAAQKILYSAITRRIVE